MPWESRESIASKSGMEIILLYPVLVKQIWIAEPVLEHLSYEERLVAETRYPGEDSEGSYPSMYILEWGRRVKMTKDDRFRFFSVVSSKKTRNGHKSRYAKFHLNIRNF